MIDCSRRGPREFTIPSGKNCGSIFIMFTVYSNFEYVPNKNMIDRYYLDTKMKESSQLLDVAINVITSFISIMRIT